jgi:hypothetical protein
VESLSLTSNEHVKECIGKTINFPTKYVIIALGESKVGYGSTKVLAFLDDHVRKGMRSVDKCTPNNMHVPCIVNLSSMMHEVAL